MQFLKRVLRYALRILMGCVVVVLLYLLAAWALSHISVPAEANGGNDVTAYILSNGVHTDIVVPVRTADMDWSRVLPFGNTSGRDTSAKWLAMGWGDKGFYLETPTWGDLTARVACNAMFGLGTTAMHATYHHDLEEGEGCKRISLSRAQYKRLVSYLVQSFAHDAAGRTEPIATNANYGTSDAFYEGVGSYSAFHTCNTWTNNGLKACGQKACWWTPFDGAILDQYK